MIGNGANAHAYHGPVGKRRQQDSQTQDFPHSCSSAGSHSTGDLFSKFRGMLPFIEKKESTMHFDPGRSLRVCPIRRSVRAVSRCLQRFDCYPKTSRSAATSPQAYTKDVAGKKLALPKPSGFVETLHFSKRHRKTRRSVPSEFMWTPSGGQGKRETGNPFSKSAASVAWLFRSSSSVTPREEILRGNNQGQYPETATRRAWYLIRNRCSVHAKAHVGSLARVQSH